MEDAAPREFVMYVRSQPREERPDFPVLRPFARMLLPALAGETWYGADAKAPRFATDPGFGLSPQESQCLALVLDLARRLRTKVRVVDVTQELAPREILEDPHGEPHFFPILARPDGALLLGQEQFTPGRVKRFLRGN